MTGAKVIQQELVVWIRQEFSARGSDSCQRLLESFTIDFIMLDEADGEGVGAK
jgi:hypothetical protein